MARAGRAGQDAGGLALGLGQVLIVDPVDAERAFLHRVLDRVQLARTVGAGPGAQAAADAEIGVHQHDAVLGALVGGAGRADGDAGGLGAVQAGAGEVDRAAAAVALGLEAVDAVEPGAVGGGAVGVRVGERAGVAAGVPGLAGRDAGVAADAGVEVDDQAQLLLARGDGGVLGHRRRGPAS